MGPGSSHLLERSELQARKRKPRPLTGGRGFKASESSTHWGWTNQRPGIWPTRLALVFLKSPGSTVVKNLPASAGDTGDPGSIPRSGRSPGVGNGLKLAPVFLPGKFHWQRSLAGNSLWSCKELSQRGEWEKPWAPPSGQCGSWRGGFEVDSHEAGSGKHFMAQSPGTVSRNLIFFFLFFLVSLPKDGYMAG